MYAARHRASKARALFAMRLAATGLVFLLAPAVAEAEQNKKEAPSPLGWQRGPARADLGNVAQIQVPEGFQFTGIDGTKKILEMMGNPTGTKELGLIMPDSDASKDQEGDWFIVFEFDPIGYVKDEDQKNLSAEAIAGILDSIRRGNDAANVERKRRGWSVINVDGWEQQPSYDVATHNLVWAIRGATMENGKTNYSINYNTRILGREGVLSANLVVDPDKLRAVVPTYQKLVSGVAFKPGKSYAEMRAGDKIAEYGLIGLITGGVGAVAVKTGFFTKFLKPILVGIVVAFGAVVKGIKSFFGKLTGSAGNQGV